MIMIQSTLANPPNEGLCTDSSQCPYITPIEMLWGTGYETCSPHNINLETEGSLHG